MTRVVLHRLPGWTDGKRRYHAGRRFAIYWSERQGARSVWIVHDYNTQRFLRCDNLAECRETIAEILNDEKDPAP